MRDFELMIGDIVLANKEVYFPKGTPVVVHIIEGDYRSGDYFVPAKATVVPVGDFRGGCVRCDELSPMPLTQEMLERTFRESIDGIVRWWTIDDSCFHVEFLMSDGTKLVLPYMQYVHELQHAMRMCGIEMDIVLN